MLNRKPRVVVRIVLPDFAPDVPGYAQLCFLDSGADCNPGRVMFWHECGGHGEGYTAYALDGTRPATDAEARAALEKYCGLYDCKAEDYRLVKRHTAASEKVAA